MSIEEFIRVFADQFDETDFEEFKPETYFRTDLDEWSSLTGLAVLNIIKKEYGVNIIPTEFKSADTIESLYNLVVSKM